MIIWWHIISRYVINVNVPSDVKEEANKIFESGVSFDINQQLTKEFSEALKELDYMENHIEEYKVYYNVDKMFEDVLNEK